MLTTSPIWTTCRCDGSHRNIARWLCCATGGFKVQGSPLLRREAGAAVLCWPTRTAFLYLTTSAAAANSHRPGRDCHGCLLSHHAVTLSPESETIVREPT